MRRSEKALANTETIAALNAGEYGILSTIGSDGYPYGVPIHYAYDNGIIYFHSAVVGHKLDNISNNCNVSFCVVVGERVIPSSFTTRYQSVIVMGKAKELYEEEKREGLIALVKKLSGNFVGAGIKYIEANWNSARLFKIDIEQITGKGRTIIWCKNACPADVNVPGYIALIKAGRIKDAYNLIRQANPFPAVCGRICVHPCESKCIRGELDQAIAIRHLKRYAADYALANDGSVDEPTVPANGKRVGIIGAGPSGLTCGYFLARLGYAVELYEKHATAGGVLAFGIPEFRLPKDVLQKEVELIERAGVRIHLTTEIGKDITFAELKRKYDAIYLAVGSQLSKRPGIPREDLPGVYYGLDFLRNVNLKKQAAIGKTVVVVGGGDVALDVARVTLRLGATTVQVVCLEPTDRMPASPDEVRAAQDEGIVIHPSTSVIRITEKLGAITGIECLEVASLSFDEQKRPQITVRENSTHMLPADTVIFAIGQSPDNVNQYGLTLGHGDIIQVDREALTVGQNGIFAGGDVVRGSDSVIAAIADGKRAAMSIDKYLGGTGNLNTGPDISIPAPATIDEIVELSRFPIACLDPGTRESAFDEVCLGFDEVNATSESNRCLRCDR
jgi:NADH-quinone oxidoreductase subunit F